MPRKSIIVPGFIGGVNNAVDARYINDTELAELINCRVSYDGRLELLGEFIQSLSTGNSLSLDPWYGFTAIGVDHNLSPPYTSGSYQAYIEAGEDVGAGGQKAYIYDASGTLLYTIVLSTTGNSVAGIFGRNADGYIIENANINISANTKIFFFVNRAVFSNYDTTAVGGYNPTYTQQGWFDHDYWPQDKTVYFIDGYKYYIAPDEDGTATSTSTTFYVDTSVGGLYSAHKSIIEGADADGNPFGLYSQTNNLLSRIRTYDYAANTMTTDDIGAIVPGATWDGDYTAYITPPPGKGLSLMVEEVSTTATVTLPDSYKFGFSYTYGINREESEIYEGTTTFSSPAAGKAFKITAIVSGFAEDQSGMRIYIRNVNSPGDWRLVMDIEASNGYKHDLYDLEYNEYYPHDLSGGTSGVTGYKLVTCTRTITELPVDTYQAINGVFPHELVQLRFKTFASYGGYYFYGNVLIDGQEQPDAVYRSRPHKSRVVSRYDRFEVVPNDGDEIKQLVVFGERLMVFKRRSTVIVNIGATEPFIEIIKEQAGIPNHACVVKTDYGVIWASDTGVYMFDGNSIRDLLIDPSSPLRRKIDIDWYNTFLTSNSAVAYSPITQELFIHKSYTSNNDMLVYNFRTLTWSQGYGKLASYSNMSSPGITLDGRLVYKPGNDIIQWNFSPSSALNTTVSIKTKEFFGNTTEFKKVFNLLRITSRSASTDPNDNFLKVQMSVDDGSFADMSGNLNALSQFSSVELKSSSGNRQDFRWVQFAIVNNTASVASLPADFAIKGMEIIYRDKGYRNE